MNISKLEEVYSQIDVYERLANNLLTKLNMIKDEKSREESVQHLLKYELSQVLLNVEKDREARLKEEAKLKHLTKVHQDLNTLIRHMNYQNILIETSVQLKEESVSALQAQSNILDFETERREDEPSQCNIFTQVRFR